MKMMFLLREHLVISRINLFPMKIWKIFGINYRKTFKSQACNFETKRYKTTLLCTDKGAENHTYQRRNGCKFNPSTIKKFRHLKFRNRIVVMCNIQSGPNASLSCIHGTRPIKNKPLEIFSASGICLSCLQAFKTAFWGVLSGEKEMQYVVLPN